MKKIEFDFIEEATDEDVENFMELYHMIVKDIRVEEKKNDNE